MLEYGKLIVTSYVLGSCINFGVHFSAFISRRRYLVEKY
jgi:hypothetical protein